MYLVIGERVERDIFGDIWHLSNPSERVYKLPTLMDAQTKASNLVNAGYKNVGIYKLYQKPKSTNISFENVESV